MKIFVINDHTRIRAQAMVEFMLVLPVLFLLIYGTIEVARLIFIYSSVTNASRAAARYGSTTDEGDGTPRYLDCSGIRAIANQSAFIVNFDQINITYDHGVTNDGTQIPISGINPNPESDNCPIDSYEVRNGDRIIVQVSARYEPIIPVIPIDPLEIVSASARTFLVSVPILGSALPTGFRAETSTPSTTPSPTSVIILPTYTQTFIPSVTQPSVILPPNGTFKPTKTFTPVITSLPIKTFTPTKTPLPTIAPTITPSPISCEGVKGISHGRLRIVDNYMEMSITNNTGFTLSTAQIFVEWNHDNGHKADKDKSLHLRQVTLGTSFWNGDLYAPSTYVNDFYPTIPPGESKIQFIFQQPYNNPDGTERIIITISTPGCVNYPIDSSK